MGAEFAKYWGPIPPCFLEDQQEVTLTLWLIVKAFPAFHLSVAHQSVIPGLVGTVTAETWLGVFEGAAEAMASFLCHVDGW